MTKKYKIIEDYFENIDSEEKAYWLGFLYADGCNCESDTAVLFGLAEKDKDMVIKLRDAIYPNKDRPIKIKDKRNNFENYTSQLQYRLEIYNKKNVL